MDARIPQQVYGGVQQTVVGLAAGLSALGGEEEYLFLGTADARQWLASYLHGPCRLVEVPASVGQTRRRATFEKLSALSPRLGRWTARAGTSLARVAVAIPASDGFLESLQPDLVHFTTQQAFLTMIPSIFQVHDLQHVHRPELLSPLQVRYREAAYRAFTTQAAVVAVMTEWGRADVCAWAGVSRDRVAVVPWAPAAGLSSAPDGNSAPPSGTPSGPFVLYPAQTWAHKNHIRLLEAMKLLDGRGLHVPLICTGRRNDHYALVERRARELHLGNSVRFTGYVSDAEMAALYRHATAIVYPSLFEGWGLPIVEAFRFGVPVACSRVSVLPEVAGDAALYFDAESVEGIADAIARVVSDHELRAVLIERGRRRVEALSWVRTARVFRAIYRRLAGRPLDEEDFALLAPPTFVA